MTGRRRSDGVREHAHMQTMVQDMERENLAADAKAISRMILRMRQDALRHRVWLHLEAALQDLHQVGMALARDDNMRGESDV